MNNSWEILGRRNSGSFELSRTEQNIEQAWFCCKAAVKHTLCDFWRELFTKHAWLPGVISALVSFCGSLLAFLCFAELWIAVRRYTDGRLLPEDREILAVIAILLSIQFCYDQYPKLYGYFFKLMLRERNRKLLFQVRVETVAKEYKRNFERIKPS